MDWIKDLLPVVLIVVGAIVTSRLKRTKKPEGETTASDESPWQDLVRELKKAGSSSADTASSSTLPSANYGSEEISDDPLPSRPSDTWRSLSEQHKPMMIPVQELSSEDSVIRELERNKYFSYEEVGAEMDSIQNKITSLSNSKTTIPHPSVSVVSPSGSTQDGTKARLFPGGFNLRAAVLYSEILKPRF